jgi:hypothetical protein
MLHDPASHPIPSSAGARVRIAHLLVECLQRQPTHLVWSALSILTFDGKGENTLFPGEQELPNNPRPANSKL